MEDLSWRNIDFTESDRKSNQYYAAENVDIVMEEDPDVMDFEEELIMIKVNGNGIYKNRNLMFYEYNFLQLSILIHKKVYLETYM